MFLSTTKKPSGWRAVVVKKILRRYKLPSISWWVKKKLMELWCSITRIIRPVASSYKVQGDMMEDMQLALHKKMSNQELSEVLNFISGVLALRKANPFRVRAYQNAAAVIEQYDRQLHEMFLTDPDFDKIPGIGDTLQTKLTELFTTGNIKAFQEYVSDIPAGTYILDKVPGLGVKKAYKLASLFHLDNPDTALADLLEVAKAGKIRDIEGFGEKSEAVIIEALKFRIDKKRLPLAEAMAVATELLAELRQCPAVTRAEALGSLRRQLETVGDIDLGIAVSDIEVVKNYIKQLPHVKKVLVAGDQMIRVMLHDNHQVDIKVATPEEWGAFLQHFTGSKEHNIRLREFALKQGKSLSEHGIKVTDKEGATHQEKYPDEESFYLALGLNWIKPEDRVGRDEITKAKL